nr:hypothetical protein [Tanacetum cinerariifolium]
TPPQGRFALVEQALRAGKHVLVEKPPCSTLGEALALIDEVNAAGVSGLFAWHSRFAPGVLNAKQWLEGKTLKQVRIDWKEQVRIDWKEQVRKWHPGQAWIWQAGGLGVFDPGINALSIITELLPRALFVESAHLNVPGNCQSPIAASLQMRSGEQVRVVAELDFDHSVNEQWSIELECEEGVMRLDAGGAQVTLDGVSQEVSEEAKQLLLIFTSKRRSPDPPAGPSAADRRRIGWIPHSDRVALDAADAVRWLLRLKQYGGRSDVHDPGQGDGERNDECQQDGHVDGHCGQILVWEIDEAIIRICEGKLNGVRTYVGNRWKQ